MPTTNWRAEPSRRLDGNRLLLSHGPIDLVIRAWGEDREVQRAYAQAGYVFRGILKDLVKELSMLRSPITSKKPEASHPVTKQMVEAVWPHRPAFVTPMASVAGAVADYILNALSTGRILEKAYVNNGGDIACQMGEPEQLSIALADPIIGLIGSVRITSRLPSRGIATSGWRGRSFSLGIADAVTVLASTSAQADVAATLIGNTVSLEHRNIERLPACEIDVDSDLGEQLVTVNVGTLEQKSIDTALAAGQLAAESMVEEGLIHAAGLSLQGSFLSVGETRVLIDHRLGVASSNTFRNLG